MNPKAVMVVIALVVSLGQQKPSGPEPASAVLPAEAAQVARDFLFAFSRNDREQVKAMLPRRLENLYGPCPFTQMPKLAKPRADGRVGAVDFEGVTTDPSLPRKGIIVLRHVEENGVRGWRVRQLYWYRKLPPEAEIPERSPTSADRAQEPELRRAAVEFLEAWRAEDYAEMDGLTFHWWEVPRRPPKWVNMTGAELTGRATTLGGLRVDFVAKLRVLRFLPKRVSGNLWLVKEDGVWRVRPLTFTFLF